MSAVNYIKNAKVWRQTIRPNFQSTARVSLKKNVTVAGRKWRSTVSTVVRSNGQICIEGMITFEDSIRLGIGFSGKCKVSMYNQTSSEWIPLSFNEFSEVAYLTSFALNFSFIFSEGEVLDYLNLNRDFEFEVQMVVERIVDRTSDLRLFNFYDPYPKEKIFSFCSDKKPKQLHTREQMIMFHSPVIESFIGTGFRRMSVIRHSYYCELLLQLVHGTQLQLSYTQVRRLLPIANRYKVYSVLRKCEFRLLCLMKNDAFSETLQEYFNLALRYNLKTLWTVLLKRATSLEELKVYTSQMNVGTMPGEAMKKVTQQLPYTECSTDDIMQNYYTNNSNSATSFLFFASRTESLVEQTRFICYPFLLIYLMKLGWNLGHKSKKKVSKLLIYISLLYLVHDIINILLRKLLFEGVTAIEVKQLSSFVVVESIRLWKVFATCIRPFLILVLSSEYQDRLNSFFIVSATVATVTPVRMRNSSMSNSNSVSDVLICSTGFLSFAIPDINVATSEFCQDFHSNLIDNIFRLILSQAITISRFMGSSITILMVLLQMLCLKFPERIFWKSKFLLTISLTTLIFLVLLCIMNTIPVYYLNALCISEGDGEWIFWMLNLIEIVARGIQIAIFVLELLTYFGLKILDKKSTDIEKYQYTKLVLRLLVFCFFSDHSSALVLTPVSCTITDFYMTFLMQPLPLYPVFGGFCTGILATYFDVWAHYLMVCIITMVICQMEALTFCFLRKHQSIGSILNYHLLPGNLYNLMIFRAFLLPVAFYMVFWRAGIKRDELMDYVRENYPDYVIGFSTIRNFALYTFDFWTMLVLFLSVFIAAFAGLVFTFTTIDMLQMLKSVQRRLSTASYNRHKNAVRSLIAQFATSSLCLVPPLFLVVIILGEFEKAQGGG
ncbi:hypothetical protein CRE_06619 [Caenorhabditis remanei]|uniref:G protein-coupled receptor n=1 Tax=Caenorhabditis remanei TaxID=31234 RepID=E3M1T9_CAERE|nr:hypothetical protein CRE_06619 [Caenorhabditis remanei]